MTRAEILQAVTENLNLIVESSRGRSLDEAKSIRDYGADSLEMVEVVSRTMKQLQVKVKRTELSTVSNIGELVDLLANAQQVAPAMRIEVLAR